MKPYKNKKPASGRGSLNNHIGGRGIYRWPMVYYFVRYIRSDYM